MIRVVAQGAKARGQEAAGWDSYIAPSGARYDYSGNRVIAVSRKPTLHDEISFVRHMARRSALGVRVLGIALGGGQ